MTPRASVSSRLASCAGIPAHRHAHMAAHGKPPQQGGCPGHPSAALPRCTCKVTPLLARLCARTSTQTMAEALCARTPAPHRLTWPCPYNRPLSQASMPLRSPGRRPLGRPRCFIPWCPPLRDLSSSDAACVSPGRAASPAADAQGEPSRTSRQRNQGLMGSGNSHPTFLRGGGVWQDRPGKLPSAVPARIRPVSVRGQPTTGVAARSSGPVWGRVPAPCSSPALRGSPPATPHTGARTPPAHPPDISFLPTDNTQNPRLWGGACAAALCGGLRLRPAKT